VADNVTLNAGSGGAVVATDEVTRATVVQHVQYVKLMNGTDAAIDVIAGDATNGLDVDVTRSALPTGASTSANQTTIIGHLDGVEGLLTTIDADTGSIAGCVAGTELQVDIVGGGITGRAEDSAHSTGHEGVVILAVRRDTAAVGSDTDGDYSTFNVNSSGRLYTSATIDSALPAGTNNIGDVDVLSVVPGTGATALGKAEDAAHTTGDTGVAILAVRRDTAASGAGTDGDYATINVDSVGAQWVRSTGELTDDAAFTPGTSRVVPIGLQADETATDSIDEGDIGAPRMTLDRKQIVTPYVHAAAGGASNYTALSTAAVLSAEIKGSAGKVFSLECFNINAAARFVRLYNQTGAPASTDTANVVWQGIIPGATTGGGFTISWPMGKQFTTGIGIRASTGIAHNDTGALAANELTFNVSYA
jgi:hypothetical protein